tara:strand:+ start:20637 stop:20849 length:213 start_codon:yes stop_codon:yes gene_type:complete
MLKVERFCRGGAPQTFFDHDLLYCCAVIVRHFGMVDYAVILPSITDRSANAFKLINVDQFFRKLVVFYKY